VIIYPIDNDDIYSVPQGSTIFIPSGATVTDDKGKVTYTYPDNQKIPVVKQGWVLSDFYVNQVMEAKVKK